MAISFVAAGTEASGTSGTTITPALPAGIANDDVLICVADCWDGNAVASMASGWTQEVNLSGNTNYPSFAVFWHRQDGSNPSRVVTFSGSSGDGKIAGICAFRGCKTSGSPFNVTRTTANGTDNTIEHGPLTTTVDNCFLVCVNGTDGQNTRSSLASGFTNIFEDTGAGTQNAYGATDCSIHASYKDQGTQGSTGSLVVSGSSIPGWGSSLLALEPASVAISLPADSGSYALTGTATTLKQARKVAAAAGSYAFIGSDVVIRKGYKVAADAGSYSLTGTAAAIRKASRVNAQAGSYALTGSAAGMFVDHRLPSGGGAYAITGADAAIALGRRLALGAGAYALNGADITFHRSVAVAIDAGAYAINGDPLSIVHARKISGEVGAYDLSGYPVAVMRTYSIDVDVGTYVLNGQDASLIISGAPTSTDIPHFNPFFATMGRMTTLQ